MDKRKSKNLIIQEVRSIIYL